MTHALSEIIASGLEAAAAEMCASLIRTAYSPNVKERADCSTALCDLQGRTLALASHSPAHLGSTLLLVPAITERFPIETLRPGDVFFANDPYIVGVTHLNDCTAAAPIFFGGEPVAFAAAIAHHSDVGGRVPGSESGDSTSIYQEGIRLPPVKLYDGGERRDDVWELFLLNSRTPHFSEGDLYAQRAALMRGAERVEALYGKYSIATMDRSVTDFLDATERRTRARIRQVLTNGQYFAQDWLDEDGISDNPVLLAVTVTVEDGHVHFDFSASASQINSGKNVPLTHTMATIYYCLKAIIDPDLPINEGLFRAVSVEAPKGSVVNPEAPAGVSSRNLTSMILADIMIRAMGEAAPDRAMATSGTYQGIILSGHDPVRDRYFVDYENFAGGQGALCDGDGMESVQVHMTNTSNLPIEVMEVEFPVRVEQYAFVADSGGAGQYRGGLGVRRDLRILADDTSLALRSARQRFPAGGERGGGAGAPGSYRLMTRDGGERRLPSTLSEFVLNDGDLLRIETPGGGGFGHPSARDPKAIGDDIRQGKLGSQVVIPVHGPTADSDDQ